MRRPSTGFTLIEMLGVIVIILLLASLILATAKYARNKAQRNAVEGVFAQVAQENSRYMAENAFYPAYIGSRYDPWNNNYLYRTTNDGREYIIGSMGADMKPGKARYDDDRFDLQHPYRSNGVDVTVWTELGYGDDIVGGDTSVRIRFAP